MNTQSKQRLLSLVLVLAMLMSYLAILPVMTSAATVGTETSSTVKQVLLYRDFEDDYEIQNGGSLVIDSGGSNYITKVEGSGNSYVNFATRSSNKGNYLLYNLTEGIPESGSIVIQFDVMVSSAEEVGQVIYGMNGNGASSTTVTHDIMTIGRYNTGSCGSTNYVPTYAANSGTAYQATASGWYTCVIVFSYSDKASVTSTFYCYEQGGSLGSSTSNTTYTDTDARPNYIRVQAPTTGTWNMDNLLIYTSNSTDPATVAAATVDKTNRGTLFNPFGDISYDSSTYEGSYYFKLGALSALKADGTKATLTEAPFEYNGAYYVPVSALTAVGATPSVDTYTETVNGISAVNFEYMDELYSYYASYSNTGLIAVSLAQGLLNEDTPTRALLDIANKFLFDNVSSSTTNNNAFTASSLDHPYLFADQAKFDELAAVYEAGANGDDPVLYSYIEYMVKRATSVYNQYATVSSGSCTGVNKTVGLVRGYQDSLGQIPYSSAHPANSYGDGYDVGGRLNEAASNNERIQQLAFAYQITRDDNYALLAYYYAVEMGKWEHWGPGHFLNVADAMSPYAIAYDWLYDAWVGLDLDVTAIETILFTHGIIPAYWEFAVTKKSTTSNNVVTPHLPWWSKTINGWSYHTAENNWNGVCSNGTTVAALALMGLTTSANDTMIDITVDGTYSATTNYESYGSLGNTATYQQYAEYIINQNLYYLPIYGLYEYSPDGSYIESNSYWSYGTNNIFEMVAALISATGSDWGILDGIGMDRTAYYALNTMSSDGMMWSYHDSESVGPQDTYWFQFLASETALGDEGLGAIRHYLLENTSSAISVWDSIYYRQYSDDEIASAVAGLAKEYYMEGIDAYVVRDSWDANEGTLFGAFMGHGNNVAHGQIDSGAFIYYNKGTKWFRDIGTENYNCKDYFGSQRYYYYKSSAEGNNTLFLTSQQDSLPYGQALNGFAEMIDHGETDYGSYAVIDQTTMFGGYASSAYRGMMLANDRRTFVIQDQVVFSSAQSAAWVAHTEEQIILSVDGTVAYLYDGENVIKVTLIDNTGSGHTFEIMDVCDETQLLDATHEQDYSINNGGVAQDDVSMYQKLVVQFTDVTEINVAIVIEEVPLGATVADMFNVGYQYHDMLDWANYSYAGNGSEGESGETQGQAVGTVTVRIPLNTNPKADPDTPIVDLFSIGEEVASYSLVSTATTDEYEETVYSAYTFDELAGYINTADPTAEVIVDLQASNTTPISIGMPCVINTNGYKLVAISPNYIADVQDGTVEYKSGSVTVTYYVNGTAYTEAYTNSVVYTNSNVSTSSAIREEDNGDGTYSYYTGGGGWALTSGGKAVTDNELIITTANNTFYSADVLYTGLYVTVALDGTITGYDDPTKFFNGIVDGSTQYARISLTGDFAYDSSNDGGTGHTIQKPTNLYLNGYGITYTSSVTSDHMFVGGHKDGFNVYGPGYITNEADGSNIALMNTSDGVTLFENVDIYVVRAVTDHRGGEITFRSCNITVEKNNSAFGVMNRNNQHTTSLPKVTVDGCIIDMPSNTGTGTAVFTVTNNSIMEVIGGTTVTVKSGGYLFSITQTITKDETIFLDDYFDWENGYSQAEVRMGEIYHNCANTVKGITYNDDWASNTSSDWRFLITTDYYTIGTADSNGVCVATSILDGSTLYCAKKLTSDTSTGSRYYECDSTASAWVYYTYSDIHVKNGNTSTVSTTDATTHESNMCAKLGYTVGASFASDPTGTETIYGVVVKHNDSTKPYVIAADGDYATVTWSYDGTTVTEKWLAGSVPTPDAIKSQVTVADGQKLTFPTETVAAGGSYSWSGTLTDSFGIKVNMSLQADFSLNFYVENIGDMTFTLNGETATGSLYTIDGVSYYKVAMTGINPHEAGKTVKLGVTYNGNTMYVELTALAYIEKVLASSSQTDVAKAMMINIVKYIDTAYVYTGRNVNPQYASQYANVNALYEQYSHLATAAVVEREAANVSAVTDAIGGAQLVLGDVTSVRFNIKESYTGDVTFKYYSSVVGDYVTKTYSFTSGVCTTSGEFNGKSYIDIDRKAFDMTNSTNSYDDISITTSNGSATYSVQNYYTASVIEAGALTNLLNALYAYCQTARIYYDSIS